MKKKILTLLLVAILVVTAIPAAFPSPTEAASASSVEDAKNKIAQAQANQKKLQAQLDALAKQEESYLDQKEILERQIGELASEIAAYDNIIDGLDAEISAMEKEIASAQATYDENIEKYKAQARATYEKGETSYLDVLLGSGSFSDFLLRLDYVKQVALYEKELLGTISDSIKTIKENKAGVEIRRAEVASARAAVAERKAEVDKKDAEISKLIKSINASEAALKKQHDKEAALEEEMNKYIENELKDLDSDVVYQSGEWIWPVAKASYNYVSSGYGWRTLNGKRSFHYAIDIAAPRGTNIYASKAGKVFFAGWGSGGAGWSVKIDHGDGYCTYYFHMNSRPIVSVGDYVKQGQVIGYVGMTGGTSTGYHLDIRFYVNGKAQDPLNYLVKPSWLTRR